MHKKNVLFIAFQFPPLSVAGSYRPYKFVKHLKLNSDKINPIVLTLDPESYSVIYDNANLNNVAFQEIVELGVNMNYAKLKSQKKEKSKLQEFASIYFNIYKGNEWKLWEENFKLALSKITDSKNIDLIYVTCPPFSIGELVRKSLKSKKIPFVADMRDNWTMWLSVPFGSRMHYHISKLKESQLYQSASAVIGLTEPQIQDLEKLSGVEKSKFYYIPNSFDSEKLVATTYTKKKNSLTISYVGSFYFDPQIDKLLNTKWYARSMHRKLFFWPRKERWIYRSPYFFFQLIKMIQNKNPEIDLKVNFAGVKTDWLIDMIQDFKLQDIVELKGYIQGDELKRFYDSSDLLLITSTKVDNGLDAFIASKSFEYLKAGKKIIGIVKEGAQKEFLKGATNAIIFDADNLEDKYNDLIELARSEKVELTYNNTFLKDFSLTNTTKKLEELFLNVINKSKA